MKHKQGVIIYLVNMFILVVIGRLILYIPNRKYLYILNVNDYYLLSCIIILLVVLGLVFSKKVTNRRKSLISLLVTVCIISIIGIYYYLNLPEYTYEKAIKLIEEKVVRQDDTVQIYIPQYREEKIGFQKHTLLKMTNYVYYVHINYSNNKNRVVYRVYPIDGYYERVSNLKFD